MAGMNQLRVEILNSGAVPGALATEQTRAAAIATVALFPTLGSRRRFPAPPDSEALALGGEVLARGRFDAASTYQGGEE